jgi:uncharacterized membrane protein
MSDPGQSFGPKEQIQILMEEYKTLRAEIVQRLASMYQIAGIAGTASVTISGIVAVQHSVLLGLILFIFFFFVIWFTQRLIDFDMRMNATRLRELEAIVNNLAGTRLLVWETDHGGVWPEAQRRRVTYVLQPLISVCHRFCSFVGRRSN